MVGKRRGRVARCWDAGIGRVLVALVISHLFMGAGCGVPPLDPEDQQPDTASADTEPVVDDDGLIGVASLFEFDEDEDPEIASLPFVEDELLARVLPGAEGDDLNAAYGEIGVTVTEELPAIQTVALRVERSELYAAAEAISTNPLFESVHKSYLYDAEQLPDDSSFSRQDHIGDIGVDEAWETTTGSEDMIIAILDTGVQPDHPDLEAKLLDGWNSHDKNGDSDDVLGHGTAVAGSAAAITDNRTGVAGVSWDNPILPVRVSDDKGRAASKDIASGIIWAVDEGAKVINVSFAPLGSDRTVLAAARMARNSGALVFISTGNAGKEYRSRATDDAVFVGAVADPDELASFSNTGSFVDLVAPGQGIYTTKLDSSYGRVSGTSFSSPITAGVAALVWSVNPEFRPATIQNLLMDTAVDLGKSGRDKEYGAGRVDAAAAVAAALEIIEEEDTKAPTVAIIDPHNRETVSGTINVTAGAFDAGALADVVLFVDGDPYATDTSKPFKFAMNTKRLTNGTHTLTATATDLAGNESQSDRVRITVRGGRSGGSGGGSGEDGSSSNTSGTAGVDTVVPGVTFEFPERGSRVHSSVGIQATVTDDIALGSAEWLVNGARADVVELSGTRQVVNFLWNASAVPSGNHTITIRVFDDAGNVSTANLTLIKE